MLGMGEAKGRVSSPPALAARASGGGWFGGVLQTKLRSHARSLEGNRADTTEMTEECNGRWEMRCWWIQRQYERGDVDK